MARKKEPVDPLNDLLAAAKPETLINLIAHLANFRPDLRRECFDYLKKHVRRCSPFVRVNSGMRKR